MEFLLWLCIWPFIVAGILMVAGVIVLYSSGYRLAKGPQKKKLPAWVCGFCDTENDGDAKECADCGVAKGEATRERQRVKLQEARRQRQELERAAAADGTVTADERAQIERARAAERAIETVCPNCGWPNRDGTKFCQNCGTQTRS